MSVRGWRLLARSWDRLVAALQNEEPVGLAAATSQAGPLVEQRDAPGLIAVPARGYVYSFYIRATFAWSSAANLRAEVLSWYAQYYLPHAIQRLTRIAADAARELPPYRAADLELAVQRALAEDTWRYQRGEIVITCQPDAAVRLDERIKPTLQPHVDRLVQLEYQFEEHLRQARYAEQLSQRWATLLDEHLDANARQDVANARQEMLTAQRNATRWINELLRHHSDPSSPSPSPSPSLSPIPPQPSPVPPR
ncbi:hypothetical protein GCM10027614_13320 [Micromonospora vulcania]